ncbi:MAG TPA: site-2 protease family protein [Bacteroidota bacterium]|nr:site-2 protease family protein [Bacteroidota bacterium]
MMDYLYIIPILLFSVVIHELSHGWMALRLGDATAHDAGRLTLNPIPHIDPIGSVVVPLIAIASGSGIFIAWAKPVPVNPANFTNRRRDDLLVAVVGPLSNIVMALFCTLMFIAVRGLSSVLPGGGGAADEIVLFFLRMFSAGIGINMMLALFNLLPVPPLDGSHVAASLLPERFAAVYRKIGFFGIILLLAMMQFAPFVSVFNATIYAMISPFKYLINLAG